MKKGKGTFDIGRESCNSYCPNCDKRVIDFTGVGFFKCKFKIEGEKENGGES